jgi:hypothetical protein
VIMKLTFLAVLALAVFLIPGNGAFLQAQETAEVRGQVVNGTEGGELPDDLSVLMLITGADGRLSGTGQASPDDDGRFVFEDVEVNEGDTYTVSVDHLGIFYGTSLDASDLDDDLVLTIYETTRDASIIEVQRQVMVIAAVSKGDQTVSAIEFVQITNPTDRTLAPDLTNLDQISFLRFALPPNPSELTVNSDMPAGDIVSIGTGFALTSPVVPGGHSIDFSYTFPFEDESLSFRQSLVQGADLFQVWIPETLSGVEVLGLTSIDPVNVQGTSYRAYEGTDFPPGQGLQLEFTGLPLPGVWVRFSSTLAGGKFWQLAIPSALGATLAAMLLWGLIRGYSPVTAVDGSSGASKAVDVAERANVVQTVAALDQRFQEGDLPEPEYRDQRLRLMARVLIPESSEQTGHPEGDDQE